MKQKGSVARNETEMKNEGHDPGRRFSARARDGYIGDGARERPPRLLLVGNLVALVLLGDRATTRELKKGIFT